MNASRLAPSYSVPAYATALTDRRRAPAPMMGAGRGGGAEGFLGDDNVIADSFTQASMDTAAGLTPSQSLPHRGGGIRSFLTLRADEVIE